MEAREQMAATHVGGLRPAQPFMKMKIFIIVLTLKVLTLK